MRAAIRPLGAGDRTVIAEIVNDAAEAYRGVIPADCWHEPYMPLAQVDAEIAAGVAFHGYERDGVLIGVMGMQDRGDVTLIRHAYVRTAVRQGGIGTALLRFLETTTAKPVLIGTWADARWAIDFYAKNGYRLVTGTAKDELLTRYWSVPERQRETSVVLAGHDGARRAPEA